ncbi:O-acetyl-ADP-ribose deacetylase [Nakamurella lactea]|uniref:O-acetyl-ADP-ribose deacetylase n=1 Tax=Nakamurella lactea TaxID=459515 RepID=UPI0003F6C115|nr:O-acetyl-ADP-ribose deacetylase [Nakamurella lactea]
MDLTLVAGDITQRDVDAVVNAANSSLMGGGGVDGAIHRAGGPEILAQCREIRERLYPGGLPAGRAVATSGGSLAARWVIHTVGPVYAADKDQRDVLRSCYTSSLAVADSLGAETVAFPLISAGVFGWPKEDAIVQAVAAVCGADSQVRRVELVLFDDATLLLARQVLAES